jgi:predicted  nucleic acid-binding Zn ribbon protein
LDWNFAKTVISFKSMILAKITFGPLHGGQSKPELEDLAQGYLAALDHAGQINGDCLLAWTNGILHAHVLLAEAGMEAPSHHSTRGIQALAAILTAFGVAPIWNILDDDAQRPAVSWSGAPWLCLFTHAMDNESPVCRGDGKGPIPVCVLPVDDATKEALVSWQHHYKIHDEIWLYSGKLELPAYRQLADPFSELSTEGRDLCNKLEQATNSPTYYFLLRAWGRKRGEAQRRCPVCGGTWARTRATSAFLDFGFCCEQCRLVSHEGDMPDGGYRAAIGEYRPRRSLANTPLR